jgi:hypothetical protein
MDNYVVVKSLHDGTRKYLENIEITIPRRRVNLGDRFMSRGVNGKTLPRFHKTYTSDIDRAERFEEFDARFLSGILGLVLRNQKGDFSVESVVSSL